MEIFFKVILAPFANFEATAKQNGSKDRKIFFWESEFKLYFPFPGVDHQAVK
jgi:hypothetical protein